MMTFLLLFIIIHRISLLLKQRFELALAPLLRVLVHLGPTAPHAHQSSRLIIVSVATLFREVEHGPRSGRLLGDKSKRVSLGEALVTHNWMSL